MQLKNNKEICLPSFRGGSYGDMDRLFLPHNKLVLKKVARVDNTQLKLEVKAVDGLEIWWGELKFLDNKDDLLFYKSEVLEEWLASRLGKTIDEIYRSHYSELGFLIEKVTEALGCVGIIKSEAKEKNLRDYNKLESIKNILEDFLRSQNLSILDSLMRDYKKASILVLEGEDPFNTTIWNYEINTGKELRSLENIFNSMESAWYLEINRL